MKTRLYISRLSISILLLFLYTTVQSQDLSFLNEPFLWPDNNRIVAPIPDSLLHEDAIILNDAITLDFVNRCVKRRQSVKILNENGAAYFNTITLPQTFDITRLNNPLVKQGRFNSKTIPYVPTYKITYFAARIIRKKTVINLPVAVSTDKVYWVKLDGERVFDYSYHFNFGDLQVEDVLEFIYKADIKGTYDTDQFYVHDYFSKLKTDVTISAMIPANLKKISLIKNNHIDSLRFKRKDIPKGANINQTYTYQFGYLKPINYTQNILAGKTLPHITVSSCNVSNTLFEYTLTGNKHLYTANYNWATIPNPLFHKEKVYNKQGSVLRKYMTRFPNIATDTTNTIFFTQLTDTLNSYHYLFSEPLHYGKDPQYALTSSDRLLKQQLVEEFAGKVYLDVLFEKQMFYYIANIQDRRLGIHSTTERAHESYETELIALPKNNSFQFFMPRYHGLSYFPDELPFYFENTYCALTPINTKATKYQATINDVKFVTIPASTFNENVRTENAIYKINIDSSVIHTSIKENLNGQFSTILRHFYNNDLIDSTIKVEYFKKCTDKPHSKNQTIKLLSQTKTYPYKASYQCSEDISTLSKTIDLTNWFSFLYQSEYFKKPLTQDYYFDFAFTDTYNYLLEFNKPSDIKNITDFNTSWSNDFFEINSNLIKKEENVYLLSINVKVKRDVLPLKDSHYLNEFVLLLNKLNHLKIDYTH